MSKQYNELNTTDVCLVHYSHNKSWSIKSTLMSQYWPKDCASHMILTCSIQPPSNHEVTHPKKERGAWPDQKLWRISLLQRQHLANKISKTTCSSTEFWWSSNSFYKTTVSLTQIFRRFCFAWSRKIINLPDLEVAWNIWSKKQSTGCIELTTFLVPPELLGKHTRFDKTRIQLFRTINDELAGIVTTKFIPKLVTTLEQLVRRVIYSHNISWYQSLGFAWHRANCNISIRFKTYPWQNDIRGINLHNSTKEQEARHINAHTKAQSNNSHGESVPVSSTKCRCCQTETCCLIHWYKSIPELLFLCCWYCWFC